jgi:broad specificity phosphatase PhoE
MNVFLSFLFVLVQTWVLVWCFAFGPKWLVKEREAAKRTVSIQVTWFAAVFYLIYSRDKAFSLKQVKDAVHTDLNDPKAKTKTIIFIRHGESKWNECFNRGFGPGFILRLFDGLLSELQRMTFGDSLFIDSPLGRRGEKEALDICRYLRSQHKAAGESTTKLPPQSALAKSLDYAHELYDGDGGDMRIVSSNLRRSMNTVTIALQDRIIRKKEKVEILSCLQEISRNVDTISLASPGGVQSNMGGYMSGLEADKVFDASGNKGNKKPANRGAERIKEFVNWIFKQKEGKIVVSGHSLYFRWFFRMHLPHGLQHIAKKKKIANGGVVAFDLVQDSKGSVQILPSSITSVYLGFAKN